MSRVGHVQRTGKKNEFRVLTGKTEENTHWEDIDVDWRILKLILREVERLGVGYIHLAHRNLRWTVVNAFMNLRVP